METTSHFEIILKSWGLDSIAGWCAVQDNVFSIRLVDDRQFVLKNLGLRNENTIQRLRFEYDVLHHVAQTGLSLALPLLSENNRPYTVYSDHIYRLSHWLPNQPADVQTDEERSRLFQSYGVSIARFHHALASYSDDEILARTWQTDLQERVLEQALPLVLANLDQDRLAFFKASLAEIESDLVTAYADLPKQLVIWDCHAGNVAVDGFEVSGFIDCDHISIAPRIFDLADFLVHLIKWNIGDSRKEADWLAQFHHLIIGYESIKQLSSGERAALFYAMVGIVLIFMDFFFQGNQPELTKTELNTFDWLMLHRQDIIAQIETRQPAEKAGTRLVR